MHFFGGLGGRVIGGGWEQVYILHTLGLKVHNFMESRHG